MKKLAALALTATLALTSLTACGGNSTSSTASGGNSGATATTSDNIFRWSSTASPTTVCPYENYTEIMEYIQAKLYRYIPNEAGDGLALVPDLAEGEPTTEDGYTWIIKINPDAKWANGDPINADTFMYSWQMALDPILLYPASSGLARNIIDVVNAYDYYTQASTGVTVDWEDVGFKKVDDYTLSVTTTEKYTATQVMQHFQMRHTGPVYKDLFESGMDAGRTSSNYGTEAQYFMSSGPMKLVSWTKDAEAILEKNDYYVHADEVTLDGMNLRIVTDESTQLQLFQSGELDYIQLGTNGMEVYGEDPATYVYDASTIRELEVNFENPDKPYLNNVNFRKALYYAIDRETIAKLADYKPAPYFLPDTYSTYEDGTSFRSLPEAQAYIPENNGYDTDLAVEYFEKALAETGTSKVELNLIYNESVAATRLASEYIQTSLTKIFGEDRFKMTLTAMQNSEAVSLMRTAQNGPTNAWDLCWGAWDLTAAQYSPNRKFELYTSWDTRRYTQYNDPIIDELYPLSTTEEYRLDSDKMTDIVIQMEKAYLDNVDAIPVFQQVAYYRLSDRVIPASTKCLPIINFSFPYCSISQ